jgi:hypothetical protein
MELGGEGGQLVVAHHEGVGDVLEEERLTLRRATLAG